MKPHFKFPIPSVFSAVAGAALLMAGRAPAQDLFAVESYSGNITEFAPSGASSSFASGITWPGKLAFNSAGDLFVSSGVSQIVSGNIYEFTPGGTSSTFATGLNGPDGLAFDSAGKLFESDDFSGHIYEFTTDGAQSTFASGLFDPVGLAFQPVPEPSVFGLLSGVTALLVPHHRKLTAPVKGSGKPPGWKLQNPQFKNQAAP